MVSRLRNTARGRWRAFSLIEVVVVIVIVGVVAAIAVPRFSRAVEKTRIATMMHDTRVLNEAIEHYRTEHDATLPTLSDVAAQLTQFTDVTGTRMSPTKDPAQGVIFGPYVKAIPALSFGPHEGDSDIAAADGVGVGWIYVATRGRLIPNLGDDDDIDGVDGDSEGMDILPETTSNELRSLIGSGLGGP